MWSTERWQTQITHTDLYENPATETRSRNNPKITFSLVKTSIHKCTIRLTVAWSLPICSSRRLCITINNLWATLMPQNNKLLLVQLPKNIFLQVMHVGRKVKFGTCQCSSGTTTMLWHCYAIRQQLQLGQRYFLAAKITVVSGSSRPAASDN